MSRLNKICNNYLNAIPTLSNFSRNNTKTNLLAIAKLVSYCLIIPPLTALTLRNIIHIPKEQLNPEGEKTAEQGSLTLEQSAPLTPKEQSAPLTPKQVRPSDPRTKKAPPKARQPIVTKEDIEFENASKLTHEEKRLQIMKSLAAKGHAKAAYEAGMALKYFFNNNEEAAKYFKQAAKLANPEACYEYGLCMERGSGVVKNIKNAFLLYTQAAQYGSKNGLLKLADYYEQGIGMPADEQRANKYRTMAENPPPIGGYKL